MNGNGGWHWKLGAIAACALASAAAAQFSDSYNFIKAVRDKDPIKVTAALDKPGNTMLSTYDEASGETPLDIVIKRRDATYVSFFLSRGADPNLRDRKSMPPIIVAAQLGWTDGIALLLQAGARIDATNGDGETALIIAVHQHDLPTTRMLIANGADPKRQDRIAGKSAIDYVTDDPRGGPLLKVLQDAKPKATAKIYGPSPN